MPYSTLIDPPTLQANLENPDWVIVDCRFDLADTEAGRRAFETQHIRGAVYADLDRDLSGPPLTDHGRHPLPSPARMRQVFGKLGIDANRQVVAYDDRGGVFASRLWWMLKYMGHNAVAVLNGGWPAWLKLVEALGEGVEENAMLGSGPASNESREFSGQPQESWLVVLEDIADQQCLIDSRAPDRYCGDVEPMDPVAGHIPGAMNYHYALNLNPDQTMKSPDELRAQFDSLLADNAPEDTTFYCGSGVSACVNLLAAAHAGLPPSKLYVGSWSEWCRR